MIGLYYFMRKILNDEIENGKFYFNEAILEGLKSNCLRSKCGSVLVKNGVIIGRGFNSPPKELENQRRCLNSKKDYDLKVTDKTCCMHAEQRALIDALRNGLTIEGSKLFFIRINEKCEVIFSGKPYCTMCSKMALDLGVIEWILWHKEGIFLYNSEEYNSISFEYQEN